MATILVVDDRPSNRQYLVALLGYFGHRLLEASDGVTALEKVRAEHPDLVITDILMPRMDGYEFVKALRSDPGIAQTPVIFYTASYLEAEARALGRDCVVSAVIPKPGEPQEVIRVVNGLLGVTTAGTQPLPPQKLVPEPLALLIDIFRREEERIEVAGSRLAALIDLGILLTKERDLARLLETFCHSARKIIGSRYTTLGLLDDDERTFRSIYTSGYPDRPESKPIEEMELPRLREVLQLRRPLRVGKVGGNAEALGLPKSISRCLLALPIASSIRPYGLLYFGDKLTGVEFSEEEELLGITVAAQAAAAIENVWLYNDIQRHAARLQIEVSERKQAEEALREREERFRQLAENIREVFSLTTADYSKVIYASPAYEQVWKKPLQGVYENPMAWAESIHPEDIAQVHAEMEKARRGMEFDYEHRIVCPDGKIRWIRTRGFPIQNEAGQFYRIAGIAEDITDRKRLEEQLRQAQKLEAVGTLAGGIAHDFNNLLTIISGYTDLVLGELELENPLRKEVDEIKVAAARAAALTRQLLIFSRKQVAEMKILNLNSLVAGVENLLRRLIGEDIKFVTHLAPDVGQIKADPAQIEQVVMNLAVNSRDAMPKGGILTIETANVEPGEDLVRQGSDLRPEPYVMLAVTDTGCGMDKETRLRIFEPFFTTKPLDKGTGLGLATVYGIVKDGCGHIEVNSEPGRGTTFRIYLPRAEGKLAQLGTSDKGLKIPTGSETVLLVEDEVVVRKLARRILEGLGYTVLEASDGPAALRISQDNPGQIHMLVADVVLPEMRGDELARQLLDARSNIKVLYLSGYTDRAAEIMDSGAAFIAKPFTMEGLARKVREVLDH